MIDVVDNSLRAWNDVLDKYTFNSELPIYDILVPTIDTLKCNHLVEWLLYFRKPTFLTGKTGVGKSVVINDMLREKQEARGFDQ